MSSPLYVRASTHTFKGTRSVHSSGGGEMFKLSNISVLYYISHKSFSLYQKKALEFKQVTLLTYSDLSEFTHTTTGGGVGLEYVCVYLHTAYMHV